MLPIVVTTGQRYCDLDALACVIAYCEIDPVNYLPVIPGPLNHSVTQTIKKWGFKYDTKPPNDVAGYIVMDISEDQFIAEFVDIKKVVEIYDHHYGFESIWRNRPWVKTQIEEIGACATLVWEQIKKVKTNSFSSFNLIGNPSNSKFQAPNPKQIQNSNIQAQNVNLPINQSTCLPAGMANHLISRVSANLLYTAIVTHTLNFKISITKDRDRQAAEELKPLCNLPDSWIPQYYREIEQDIYRDPVFAIANDTKIAYLGGQSMAVCSTEMWLPEMFIKENINIIRSALRQFETELWLYSSPCVSKGFNYLLTDSQTVKEWLKMYIGATFDKNSDLGTTSKLWLRKEILRELERK